MQMATNRKPGQVKSVQDFGKFQLIGSFQLPLQVCDGRVVPFRFDYFQFSRGRYTVMSRGQPQDEEACLVRWQSQCVWGNFGSRQCDCRWQFEEAKRLVADEPAGLIVFAHDQIGKGIGLRNHSLVNAEAARHGVDDIFVEAYEMLGFRVDDRNFDDMIDILRYYGLHHVRLLTNNLDKLRVLEGAGFEVTRVPLLVPLDEFNRTEMTVKANKAGHLISHVSPSSS